MSPATTPPEALLRNLGIVAHINAGKTTLSERILFHTGKQRLMGDVDDGTATMDWMPEEQQRGISISAALTTVRWRGHQINLIDTPGHVDFGAEVQRCLRVLDGIVVVLDGVRGVESQTEIIWRQADARHVPRLVYINKLDRPVADFEAALASLGGRLRARALPIPEDDGGTPRDLGRVRGLDAVRIPEPVGAPRRAGRRSQANCQLARAVGQHFGSLLERHRVEQEERPPR